MERNIKSYKVILVEGTNSIKGRKNYIKWSNTSKIKEDNNRSFTI